MKKVAVAGFGFMGLTHTINILRNKDLELKAIVDKNPALIDINTKGGNISTGKVSAEEFQKIHKYQNLEDCLHSEDLDAVHLCVHTNLHYELTRNCLLHDKHVFLEKPFCLDIKQGEELMELAEKRGKILMVGHVVRFMPPYQKLKQWIDSEEYGKLKFLSISRFCGIPAWGQWKDKAVNGTSGGALFDLVIHDIDYVNYILGLPDEIKHSSLPGKFSKHDYVSAMWSYKNKNLHVKIEGGNIFHSNFPFQAGYMAHFENASVVYSSSKGDVITVSDDDSLKDVPAGDAGEGYYNEINYFAQSINNNTLPLECMPESSLESVKLCYKHL